MIEKIGQALESIGGFGGCVDQLVQILKACLGARILILLEHVLIASEIEDGSQQMIKARLIGFGAEVLNDLSELAESGVGAACQRAGIKKVEDRFPKAGGPDGGVLDNLV